MIWFMNVLNFLLVIKKNMNKWSCFCQKHTHTHTHTHKQKNKTFYLCMFHTKKIVHIIFDSIVTCALFILGALLDMYKFNPNNMVL